MKISQTLQYAFEVKRYNHNTISTFVSQIDTPDLQFLYECLVTRPDFVQVLLDNVPNIPDLD